MISKEIFQVQYGSAPHQVFVTVHQCGSDLIVIIGGGERPHTGAVAVAYSHPSIKNPDKLTNTSSVITVPGHKEDEIARCAALKLSKKFRCTVTVSVGLHIDDASQNDIGQLIANFNASIDAVINKMIE